MLTPESSFSLSRHSQPTLVGKRRRMSISVDECLNFLVSMRSAQSASNYSFFVFSLFRDFVIIFSFCWAFSDSLNSKGGGGKYAKNSDQCGGDFSHCNPE